MKRQFLQRAFTAIVILGLGTAVATAAKPPKNPPPPSAPVRYQLQFWTIPGAWEILDVYDTNSALQTVGSIRLDLDGDGVFDSVHGYLYDPSVDAEFGVDLNTVVSNIPEGSSIRKATAINEVGQIVAYIEPVATPLEDVQSVMIDILQDPPVMYSIPDRSFTDYAIAGDINDWGDITVSYRRSDGSRGHYVYNFDPAAGILEPLDLGVSTSYAHHPRINNQRDIVGPLADGDAYRLSWNGPMQTFSGLLPRALNETGAFCGTATAVTGKGRNGTANYAFVYDASIELFTDHNQAVDLNASRDFLRFWQLYHRDYGTLTLKDLLDPNDPDTAVIEYESDLFCYTMTDREPVTSFPVLTGVSWNRQLGIQLIPVAAP